MKVSKLLILLIVSMVIFSCNRDNEIIDEPIIDPIIETTEDITIPSGFEWSASMEGYLNINLVNPLNVSTEKEFIQIVNGAGEVLDQEVVVNNTASFYVKLPNDAEFYIFYPVTTDKILIDKIGSYTIELGPTVPYVYNNFKSTNVVSCTSCDSPIENAGSELPYFASGYRIVHEDIVPGWKTTASDNKIERWASGFGGVPAQEGNHFFELNANRVAALYQELCLEPGSTIYWSVWHRGRAGVDVADVSIGASVETAIVQETMTDGTTEWGFYSGTYNVPEDQTTTVFVFNSVSSASNNSIGNFLDNFEIDCDFDGDGVIDRYDEFPEDPNASTKSQFPSSGKQIVAFEDLWPSYGDFDFNDLVMSNQAIFNKNESDELLSAEFKVSIDAIGASLDNGIAMMLYKEDKTVFVENIIASVSGDAIMDPNNVNGLILSNDVFVTIDNRYQNNGVGPVGVPDTLKFTITFNTDADDFIPELYLFRTDDRSHEVHRRGFPMTATMNQDLFNTLEDVGDFTSASQLIWGMEIITEENWKNPIEKVDILLAYPKFEAWATTGGVDNPLWYLEPVLDKVVDVEFGKK